MNDFLIIRQSYAFAGLSPYIAPYIHRIALFYVN